MVYTIRSFVSRTERCSSNALVVIFAPSRSPVIEKSSSALDSLNVQLSILRVLVVFLQISIANFVAANAAARNRWWKVLTPLFGGCLSDITIARNSADKVKVLGWYIISFGTEVVSLDNIEVCFSESENRSCVFVCKSTETWTCFERTRVCHCSTLLVFGFVLSWSCTFADLQKLVLCK